MTPQDRRRLAGTMNAGALLLAAAATVYSIKAGYRPGIYLGSGAAAFIAGYLRLRAGDRGEP